MEREMNELRWTWGFLEDVAADKPRWSSLVDKDYSMWWRPLSIINFTNVTREARMVAPLDTVSSLRLQQLLGSIHPNAMTRN